MRLGVITGISHDIKSFYNGEADFPITCKTVAETVFYFDLTAIITVTNTNAGCINHNITVWFDFSYQHRFAFLHVEC